MWLSLIYDYPYSSCLLALRSLKSVLSSFFVYSNSTSLIIHTLLNYLTVLEPRFKKLSLLGLQPFWSLILIPASFGTFLVLWRFELVDNPHHTLFRFLRLPQLWCFRDSLTIPNLLQSKLYDYPTSGTCWTLQLFKRYYYPSCLIFPTLPVSLDDHSNSSTVQPV